jgi:hypothetical protein
MPSRTAAAKLPKAYEEDVRVNARPAPVPEHFISLEHAEPSPMMESFRKGWKRIVGFFKVLLVLGVIGAYPAAILFSSHVYDSPVIFPANEAWSVPGVGVAVHKIARERAGAGLGDLTAVQKRDSPNPTDK